MKKEHILTKISFAIDIVAILIILFYFIVVVPNWETTGSYGGLFYFVVAMSNWQPFSSYGGFLILSPPLFGLFGLITAISGRRKNKTNLGIALIIINIIFLCWWPILWFGGTLLLGP